MTAQSTTQPDPIFDAIRAARNIDDLTAAMRAGRGQWQAAHSTALIARVATIQDTDALLHDLQVRAKADQLGIAADARALLASQTASQVTLPDVVRLEDFLAVPDEPTAYRIGDLWPAGGRVLLAAQYKAGKSSMVGNVARSLADGAAFLDRFEVQRADRVVLVDNELDPRTLRRWLRDQNIANPDRVDLVTLRGRVSAFNIIDAATRARWVDLIGSADVLILDCLRPVLDALGLSEDKEAGRFLVAFDALLTEASIGDALLVHHAGHGGERSRGDSRLRDWPDAEWRLVRDGDEPDAPRYFTAFGRDVDVKESRLIFEPLDRSLRLDGGSRRDAKIDEAAGQVVDVLADQERPLSGREVVKLLDGVATRRQVEAALRRLVETGQVLTEEGPRNARLHFLNPSSEPVRRSATQRVGALSSSVSVPPYRGHTHSLSGDAASVPQTSSVRDAA